MNISLEAVFLEYSEEETIDEIAEVEEIDTQEDNKWYGVPPKGEQPLPDKWIYVLMIIGIIILEIGIWAVYRYLTAELFEGFGTHLFYLVHIIAAPTIHLLPILLFWLLIRGERGLPFVFTKKLLLSGIIIGFIAAIIWRLLEEFTFFGFASAAGGTSGPLEFINILETADLFILMTFVMYFIVGPVEELEFRSFTQDQVARVLPNLQALIISSVLFGCSHIPIAIFVYELHLEPTQFADALFSWIAAGFTFGVLYMYSRNIFACIVMHGMGNWQLSVFYFMARPAGMEPTTAMYVGIATSLISNAVMIVLFYLINKYYWEPHRRGEAAFGGRFLGLQTFIHDHDFEKKPVVSTIIVFTLFIVIVSGMIMGAAAIGGSRPLWMFPAEGAEDSSGTLDLESLVPTTEELIGSGTLTVGNSENIVKTSESGKYIQSITVTVTWTDEDDIRYLFRTYVNEPDTFKVSIVGPNITAEAEDSNPPGGQGSITANIVLTDEDIIQIVSDSGDNYRVNVEITLEDAGNFNPGIGLVGITDDENNYDYTIDIVWLTSEETQETEEQSFQSLNSIFSSFTFF